MLLLLLTGFVGIAVSTELATPEARAAALVARMTREEKVSQLINAAPAIPRRIQP